MYHKVLCHRAEVAGVVTTDCVFSIVIDSWKILCRKQSMLMLMELEGVVERHQTLSSWVGSGHKLSLVLRIPV